MYKSLTPSVGDPAIMKQSVEKINIHSILPLSEVNGPGKRCAIWVQGCIFRCKGCFNPDLLPFTPRMVLSIDEIINKIPFPIIEGVTMSGGEPFCQAKAVSVLAKAIVQKGLSLMVYSGYTYDDIVNTKNRYIRECMKYIDILVAGPYQENIKPDTIWAGSGNQKIIFLTNRYREYEKKIYTKHRYCEYHIDNNGFVKATGF